MKKILASLLVFVFATVAVQAQDQVAAAPTPEYISGKWNITVKGTPNGDVTMPARFEIKEGVLKGYFMEPDAKEEKKMDTVYLNEGVFNMAFTIMSYDVTITMNKKDDDNATGSLMGMFDVVAVRVKEEKEATKQ
ncbi:MAG: hypothetical protein RL131_127 [Bacteroidota bacterium]